MDQIQQVQDLIKNAEVQRWLIGNIVCGLHNMNVGGVEAVRQSIAEEIVELLLIED